jgi:organic radical activating enzyme
MPSKDEFLYPRSRYQGDFSPSNLAFNANLQEFAARVGYICALETNGKLSSAEAYQQIKQIFKELKRSKKSLGIEAQGMGEDRAEPSA